MDRGRIIDNVQNTNARFIDNFGSSNKTSVRTTNPPGGKSSFSLGWSEPEQPVNRNKNTNNNKNFNSDYNTYNNSNINNTSKNNNYNPEINNNSNANSGNFFNNFGNVK